jgi:hypothetical protein
MMENRNTKPPESTRMVHVDQSGVTCKAPRRTIEEIGKGGLLRIRLQPTTFQDKNPKIIRNFPIIAEGAMGLPAGEKGKHLLFQLSEKWGLRQKENKDKIWHEIDILLWY